MQIITGLAFDEHHMGCIVILVIVALIAVAADEGDGRAFIHDRHEAVQGQAPQMTGG